MITFGVNKDFTKNYEGKKHELFTDYINFINYKYEGVKVVEEYGLDWIEFLKHKWETEPNYDKGKITSYCISKYNKKLAELLETTCSLDDEENLKVDYDAFKAYDNPLGTPEELDVQIDRGIIVNHLNSLIGDILIERGMYLTPVLQQLKKVIDFNDDATQKHKEKLGMKEKKENFCCNSTKKKKVRITLKEEGVYDFDLLSSVDLQLFLGITTAILSDSDYFEGHQDVTYAKYKVGIFITNIMNTLEQLGADNKVTLEEGVFENILSKCQPWGYLENVDYVMCNCYNKRNAIIKKIQDNLLNYKGLATKELNSKGKMEFKAGGLLKMVLDDDILMQYLVNESTEEQVKFDKRFDKEVVKYGSYEYYREGVDE